MLNPRNRPDSLTIVKNPSWRLDGCQTDGHRLFITPRFALNRPPKRIDIYLSDEDVYDIPEGLRRILELNKSMTVPSRKSWCVPLSQHLLRALEHWSRSDPRFQREYEALPFGSYIAVETIRANQARVRMHLVPRYDTEREWMSVPELNTLWNGSGASTKVHWPEIIDLEELQLVEQPHEAISIVRIPKQARGNAKSLFAFKSALDDLRYMYHELWRLLTIEPHPNVVARPLYVVTALSRFGAKQGVCGFVLEYHARGTMRDLLVRSQTNRQVIGDEGPRQLRLSVADKFRIARELTSALLHLQKQGTFYSGIKYTNIVMTARQSGSDEEDGNNGKLDPPSTSSPVLIDFDHRSGRYIWTPPEIHHIVHVEYLANSADHSSNFVPDDIRIRAANLMRVHYPAWLSEKAEKKGGYRACWKHGEPVNGFSVPWLALSPQERDRAQVYMLGRLLWHLFEEVGAIDHCLHIEVFREAGDVDKTKPVFPNFSEEPNEEGQTLTPERIRQLIRRCTAGAPEWQGRSPPLVYRNGQLWANGEVRRKAEASKPCGAEQEAQEAIRSWWIDQMHEAEQFILARQQEKLFLASKVKATIQLKLIADSRSRPLLEEVMQELI